MDENSKYKIHVEYLKNNMKSKIVIFLELLTGALFVFSGISKLLPIESFEFTLVNQGITSWTIAPYLSRFLISIEFFLGISFLLRINLKKILIPSAFILLIIFSIHLVYTIFTSGNTGNCGCFGELIQMTPLEAIIKNLILMGILVYLYKSIKPVERINYFIPSTIFLIVLILIFVLFQVKPYKVPVNNSASKIVSVNNQKNFPKDTLNKVTQDTLKSKASTNKLQSSSAETNKNSSKKEPDNQVNRYKKVKSVFSSYKNFSNNKVVDLDEGVKIVALLSLDCEHCMATAHKLGLLRKDINLPPTYFLFLGDEDQLKNFSDHAGYKFPYKIIDPMEFFPLIGDVPPRVVLMVNGNIIGDWDIKTFSMGNVKTELKKINYN